jgi:hypothetical protein
LTKKNRPGRAVDKSSRLQFLDRHLSGTFAPLFEVAARPALMKGIVESYAQAGAALAVVGVSFTNLVAKPQLARGRGTAEDSAARLFTEDNGAVPVIARIEGNLVRNLVQVEAEALAVVDDGANGSFAEGSCFDLKGVPLRVRAVLNDEFRHSMSLLVAAKTDVLVLRLL